MQSRTGCWARWKKLSGLWALLVVFAGLLSAPGALRAQAHSVFLPIRHADVGGIRAFNCAGASPVSATVIFNEVAWGGTSAAPHHEWIELYNLSPGAITLTNWSILTLDGTFAFSLTGVIVGDGYFLLESAADQSVVDIPADAVYAGQLGDNGPSPLLLLDSSGHAVDRIDPEESGWPAGTAWPDGCSMERGSSGNGEEFAAWFTGSRIIQNGTDAAGSPICGTPRRRNSTTYPVWPGDVRFNEVAWSGTNADPLHQWFELVNNTDEFVHLDGWQVLDHSGAVLTDLEGEIAPGGFFLVEAVDVGVSDKPADLVAAFAPLTPDGESLTLVTATLTIDTVNADGGAWPAGGAAPVASSMERVSPTAPDDDENWGTNDGFHRCGIDAGGNPINGTPGAANSTTQPPYVLVSEVSYLGLTAGTAGDEYVELCNAQPGSISLTGLKIGDEEEQGGSEGMYLLPEGWQLAPGGCIVIAKNAAQFASRFGFLPDCELVPAGVGYVDIPEVPNLIPYDEWGGGNWALADNGDEVLLLSSEDLIVDSVAYAAGSYAAAGVAPSVAARGGQSLQRVWSIDTDNMPADFLTALPNPGLVTPLPAAPSETPPAATVSDDGMQAYWGLLVSHSSYSKGVAPPVYVFAQARGLGMHFLAITDDVQLLSAAAWQDLERWVRGASFDGEFVALRGFEACSPGVACAWGWNTSEMYVSQSADISLPDVYTWLAAQTDVVGGLAVDDPTSSVGIPLPDITQDTPVRLWQTVAEMASSHDFDPRESLWARLLWSGQMLAPLGGSWATDDPAANTPRIGIVAPCLTRNELLSALQQRRVFVTQRPTLALTLRQGEAWMGGEVNAGTDKVVTAFLTDVAWDGAAVSVTLFDGAVPVTNTVILSASADWPIIIDMEPGHHYWARAVRSDGGIAHTAPIWVAGTANPEDVVISEVLPSPRTVDWDGDGVVDGNDEWVELYNKGDVPVGLGGWMLREGGGKVYMLPLGFVLPGRGYGRIYGASSLLPLNNDGDTITLLRPDGVTADVFVYDRDPGYDTAWCHLAESWEGVAARCAPTPGYENCPAPVASPRQVSVLEARHLPRGSWVQIKGHVTVVPGVLSERVMYLQDSHSGTRVYLPKDHSLDVLEGERLEVTGRVRDYHGEMQISVAQKQDVRSLGKTKQVNPLPIATGSVAEPYEGMLVRLDGAVAALEGGSAVWVDDGTGWARVYQDPDAPIDRHLLEIGQQLGVVGVVSQYEYAELGRPGYRLLPRRTADLLLFPVEEYLHPVLLPETGK
jgi:hypothetical protein